MALPLSINNPQTQYTATAVSPTLSSGGISFGGNANGPAASASTSTPLDLNTILLYGAIGLAAVFILKQFEK